VALALAVVDVMWWAALAVALVAVAAAWWVIVSARRRTGAALTRLADRAGAPPPGASIDDLVAQVGAALDASGDRAARAEGVADRLTDALSAVPEGVVVCDEHGQVWFRNEVAQMFAGARHGEVLADLTVTELLDAALKTGPESQYLELYGPPRRTLLIRALPLHEEGRLLGAVAVIEDVSERRRLEAVRRDFVANVSHELKSPVGALGILAEAMQLEDEPAVSRRLAERMQTEAFRVARIIDDLLDLSRIESEESPQREPLPIHTVVAQAVERIRPVAEHRGITIDVSEGPRRLTVVGDRRQLVSAVHNLLDNAVKYSDDDSVVEVRIRAAADPPDTTWAEISIEDHGIGIPTRDIERIFERFYRVDRARARDTGGTGLGLAIVRHVATNHKGDVNVVSQEGQGSIFTLRLPAGPGPVILTAPEQEAG
jgi:two-component system sensor histidine kinase SenX3